MIADVTGLAEQHVVVPSPVLAYLAHRVHTDMPGDEHRRTYMASDPSAESLSCPLLARSRAVVQTTSTSLYSSVD